MPNNWTKFRAPLVIIIIAKIMLSSSDTLPAEHKYYC